MKVYDKKGIPLEIGDVLKVFHYVAPLRREKIYMYKQVIGQTYNAEGDYFIISHLNDNEVPYMILKDNKVLDTYEIIQSNRTDYFNRERIKI